MSIHSFDQTVMYFGFLIVELAALFFGMSVLISLLRQYYLKRDNVRNWLTRQHGLGNVMGGLFGAITPFCSCSTVPILVGLLQANVPFGTTISFLLASPVLNPVILVMLGAMFGWQVTFLYGGITFVLVVLSGVAWERLGLQQYVKHVQVAGLPRIDSRPESFRVALRQATLDAGKGLRGILPYLVFGVAIGATVYGFVPQDFIVKIAGPENPLAVPFAAVIGVPLYVRVETMLPIGIAFLGKGMSIGAIVALIIGGAGASIPELSLLARIFKPRLLIAFVVTIFAIASMAGYLFNFVLG